MHRLNTEIDSIHTHRGAAIKSWGGPNHFEGGVSMNEMDFSGPISRGGGSR